MKKMLTAVLAALMAMCLILPAMAEGEVTIGQALYAAHGTKCFAVLTVAMQDGVIADAYIDEFQFMTAGEAVGVPNSDADFGQSYPEGKVLASKRENAEMYSANMAAAGSTVALDVNYAAIEDFVTGKTIEELEAAVEGKTAEEMVDAVAGCNAAWSTRWKNGKTMRRLPPIRSAPARYGLVTTRHTVATAPDAWCWHRRWWPVANSEYLSVTSGKAWTLPPRLNPSANSPKNITSNTSVLMPPASVSACSSSCARSIPPRAISATRRK